MKATLFFGRTGQLTSLASSVILAAASSFEIGQFFLAVSACS